MGWSTGCSSICAQYDLSGIELACGSMSGLVLAERMEVPVPVPAVSGTGVGYGGHRSVPLRVCDKVPGTDVGSAGTRNGEQRCLRKKRERTRYCAGSMPMLLRLAYGLPGTAGANEGTDVGHQAAMRGGAVRSGGKRTNLEVRPLCDVRY
eukprot:3270833-Rhodomonas_salina.2